MRRIPSRRTSRLRPEALDARILLSTLIAEIDTGVDLNSQADYGYYDLPDAYNAYTQQPATADGSNIADNSLGQGHGHGSAVADSIITGVQAVSSQPGVGGTDIKILPIRVTSDAGHEDANSFSAVVRGIFYAAYHQAAVINISIVFMETSDHPAYVPDNPDPSYTNRFPTFQNAIDYARSKGAIVVTGAGNDHYDIDSTDSSKNGYLPYHLFPTSNLASNLIVAASTDDSGNLTSVSNFGATHVTLGSPAFQNATSYAAGYVSGVSGALASLARGLSADGLANLVESTARVYPQLQGVVSTSAVISPSTAVNSVLTPTVVAPAAASPAAVTGTSTTLTALGTSLAGESVLSYTWTAVGGAGVTFGPSGVNGTNAAKTITANFTQPGQYTFEVKISAGPSRTATSQVTVTVTPTARALAVAPAGVPTPDGRTQSFSATTSDQFGLPITPQPPVAWSVRPGGIGGSIDGTGKYVAPASGAGQDTVVASSGNLSGTATVNVAPAVASSLAISSGSPTAVGTFQADSGASGGLVDSTTDPIDTSGVVNPAPQAVYQSERWSGDQFSYTFAGLKPGGAYTVRLHFAEIFYHSAGQRRFNVAINGSTVLANFDIFSLAGAADKALIESISAPADSQGKITIRFTNLFGGATCSGIEVTPSATIDASRLPLPVPRAVSLGQDGHDLANTRDAAKPGAGPDGLQDVHLVLSNLPTNLALGRVVVDRFGGGGSYLSDGSPWSWTAVVAQASTGTGSYSDTANVYFQPNPNVVDHEIQYQLDLYYVGQSQPVTLYVKVSDDPHLAMVAPGQTPAPTAVSLGQDGHDLANALGSAKPGAGPDGLQDVHLMLSNLPTNLALGRVVVDRFGGGGSYLSDGSPWSWTAVVAQASTGPGSYSDHADVYFQPNPNVVDVDQLYQLQLYFVGLDHPLSVSVRVTDNPKLKQTSALG